MDLIDLFQGILLIVMVVIAAAYRSRYIDASNRYEDHMKIYHRLQSYEDYMKQRKEKAIADGTYPDPYLQFRGQTFLEEEDDLISPS